MNGFLNQFPYSDFHEMNLDWIIKQVKALTGEMHGFEAANKVEYAGIWNITQQYAAWSIVLDQNTGYMMIALQPVPVGIAITNSEYWLLVAPFKIDTALNNNSYNAIANKPVKDKFDSVDAEISDLKDEDDAINLHLNNTDETVIDQQSQITTLDEDLADEISARQSADTTINSRIDSIASLAEGSTTGDAELMDIRVAADGTIYPSAGAAVRGQVDILQDNIDQVKRPKNNYSLGYTNVLPDNLIDPYELIEGKYINTSGNEQSSADWHCTDFIDIHSYSKVQGSNIGLGAWYDSSKTFISSVTVSNVVNVPSGAYYLRCSILNANVNTAILCYHIYDSGFAPDLPVSHWVDCLKPNENGWIRFTVPVNNTVATYDDTSEVNHEGVPDYVDVDCILKLPYAYKPIGKPVKLLMFCHGAGKGVSGDGNWTTVDSYNTLVSFFTSRGYAVFDCNGFKNDALGWSFWGNQRGIEAWRKAYLYITRHYNVEKTFSIYAFSMGGLTALNLAFQGFPNINAIALGSPVINLREAFNATDGTKAVLQTLYGLGDTWDESKVVGNNPYKHVITDGSTKYCPYVLPPMKIWYGSTETDNTGNPAVDKEIAKDFVDAIVNSGGYAFYREVAGRGHEICYGASTVVNQEILYFIERYEKSGETAN